MNFKSLRKDPIQLILLIVTMLSLALFLVAQVQTTEFGGGCRTDESSPYLILLFVTATITIIYTVLKKIDSLELPTFGRLLLLPLTVVGVSACAFVAWVLASFFLYWCF